MGTKIKSDPKCRDQKDVCTFFNPILSWQMVGVQQLQCGIDIIFFLALLLSNQLISRCISFY